jgi:hypothetical protein
MLFKEYVENINKLLADNPEIADYKVVYASDDEGNGYDLVHYTPSITEYVGRDGVRTEGDCEEEGEEYKPNAVIIN